MKQKENKQKFEKTTVTLELHDGFTSTLKGGSIGMITNKT